MKTYENYTLVKKFNTRVWVENKYIIEKEEWEQDLCNQIECLFDNDLSNLSDLFLFKGWLFWILKSENVFEFECDRSLYKLPTLEETERLVIELQDQDEC
ncbi:hypothetical protein [Pedobacter sp. B4-66]|uniref:hypothetical protein n=1 Tax=Pedobacter sp. B4-66 TaxID=2817280 RepID=UPI001BD9570C|nr:hypothetical protein [Pedobacter sp. B4-66]